VRGRARDLNDVLANAEVAADHASPPALQAHQSARENDRERKSADNQPACLSMNAGMSKRTCDDARYSLINGIGEDLPKPSPL
jgi:hypothetical protein